MFGYCSGLIYHVSTGPICSGRLGAKVDLAILQYFYDNSPSSRSFSSAGYSLLVYDYLLTLQDEVSLSPDIVLDTFENIPLVTDRVHLERSLDACESHVPYQPLWKPTWADFRAAGRGRPSHQ